ncbi:MAG TPA: tetratricopeptide repeat protein [Pyrinomonadaceae bacterium]|nr:tetratricopeptide repeat protein [Pyrinomonadaceae bacterium]
MIKRNIYLMLAITILLSNLTVLAQKGKTKPKPKPKASTSKVAQSSAADDAFNAGATLFKQETPDAYQSALVKFNQALGLYQNENDSEGAADCYMIIGKIYGRLKDSKQANDNYGKAIEIYRATKNYEGEAQALNNIGALARDLGYFDTSVRAYQNALNLQANLKPNVKAQILNGLGESLFSLGRLEEAKAKFNEANGYWAVSVKNEDKVRTTYNLGRISFAYNEIEQALSFLNKALAESRQFDNPVLEGDILEVLATYYNATGELTKAIEYRKRIFDAYSNAKASVVTTTRVLQSVNNLSVSYYRAGDFQSSFQYLDKGIQIGTQRGEILSTAYLIGNKGVLLTDQGKYAEAINYLNQGIEATRKSGNKLPEAYYLASLGMAYLETGNAQQSLMYLNQALQAVPAGVEPETEGKVISSLIMAYAVTGDKNKTQEAIRLASARRLDVGGTAGTVQVLYAQGFAQNVFGNFQEGLRLLSQAYSLASKLNHEVEKAKISYTASFSYLAGNDPQKAVNSAQASHDFYKKIGNDLMDMKTHLVMGTGYSRLNQLDNAVGNFNSAYDLAQKVNDVKTQALALYDIGMTYRQFQNYPQAIQYFNQSLTLVENTGDKQSQKELLTQIGDAYEKSGDKKKSKEYKDKAKKIKN